VVVPTEQANVSFIDPNGVTHTVTVAGESLYTVAAAAIAAFRRSGIQASGKLRVEVKKPARVHELAVEKLEQWVARPGGRSPAEITARNRVKEILKK
jgi:hypothetical protein